MGGKRPDQYQIDPGEAGATDYKSRVDDEKIHTQDKQEVAATREHDRETENLIPHAGKNPALADLQQRREQRARDAGDRAKGGKPARDER